jgi:Ca2+-binding RTX toxin-like protein
MLFPSSFHLTLRSEYSDLISYLNATNLFLKSLPSIPDYTDIYTDIIYGTNHKDNLKGTKYNDDIRGKGGNDTLKGLQEIDTLDGGNGNDTLIGGAGNDMLYGGLGKDNLNGGAGGDSLDGENGNDTVIGGAGDDMLYGDSGKDNLNGGDGNDYLSADSGDDVLIGGAGDDELNGDSGRDILTGGEGKDTFKLTILSGDIIKDFSVNDDVIDLDWNILTNLKTAAEEMSGVGSSSILNSDNFKIGAATDENDYLLYSSDTGVLSYDADGNGQGSTTEIAVIGSNLALSSTNFHLEYWLV